MPYNFKLVKHIKFYMAFSLISVNRKPKPDCVWLHGFEWTLRYSIFDFPEG